MKMKAGDFKSYLESKGCTVSGSGGRFTVTYGGKSTEYAVSGGKVESYMVTDVCTALGLPTP